MAMRETARHGRTVGDRVLGGAPMRRGADGVPFGRNIHESLANTLGCEIVGGIYSPGSLLPNEMVMRERFSVSRTALREAYRVLNAKGLISSRPKVGTRVRPKSDWNMLDSEVLAWHLRTAPTENFIDDLFALRQMIEPNAAAMAAGMPGAETVARIAAAFAEMERFHDGSGDLIGADLRFHLAILEATGNHFIGALGGLIHAALLGSFALGWEGVRIQHKRLVQHGEVLAAIKSGDSAAARARMSELLRDSIDDVREFLRSRGDAPASAHPSGR